jgi:CRISPR/Cas system Type II protein with McrA/HNH and RuvC-like nuclease domain
LTGEKIDLMDSSSYSLDHKTPKSRGGDCSIDNCGLTTFMANQMKSNQTLEELLENCMKIIAHNKDKINIEDIIKVST